MDVMWLCRFVADSISLCVKSTYSVLENVLVADQAADQVMASTEDQLVSFLVENLPCRAQQDTEETLKEVLMATAILVGVAGHVLTPVWSTSHGGP
jgi:hypothetical protein